MEKFVLFFVACVVVSSSAWSVPYYPGRAPVRVVRYAIPPHQHPHPPGHPGPHHRIPVRVVRAPPPVKEAPEKEPQPQWQRAKRGHDHDSHEYDRHGSSGVTGPVHTFVKTDKNANYKWGVRHHVGDKFSS